MDEEKKWEAWFEYLSCIVSSFKDLIWTHMILCYIDAIKEYQSNVYQFTHLYRQEFINT